MGVEFPIDSFIYEDDSWCDQMRRIDSDYECKNVRPKELQRWSTEHLMNWIVELCGDNNIDYEDLNMTYLSAFDGTNLIRISREVCIQVTCTYGDMLYAEIQKLCQQSLQDTSNERIQLPYSIDGSYLSDSLDNEYKRRESVNSNSDIEVIQAPQKRSRGRPKKLNTKRKEAKTGKLWEFLRDLLKNPQYCPGWICWENHDEGVFKFISSDKVAKLWGSKRGNDHMNYEKLSRAMRYYYKTQVLQPVLGKRLVYKFGPSATNWRSSNPNFCN